MALFSRAFIRKRVISLATTTSVAATSFALAKDPPRTHHLPGATPIQYVADRPEHSEEQRFLSENQQLRRLAQEIVANQQREIMVTRNAAGDKRSSAVLPPQQPRVALSPQSSPSDGAVAHGGMKMFQ
jgi:hypothetical protein